MYTDEMIRQELLAWDARISHQYKTEYAEQIQQFAASMAVACRAWKGFDEAVQGNEQRAHISSLIFGA